MPEYKVTRKIVQKAVCYIQANSEEEAEQRAIDQDVWIQNPDRYDEEFEVEEQ